MRPFAVMQRPLFLQHSVTIHGGRPQAVFLETVRPKLVNRKLLFTAPPPHSQKQDLRLKKAYGNLVFAHVGAVPVPQALSEL
jgi:hypothetical protein